MPESAGIRLECPEFLRLFVSLSRFYFVRVVFMYSPHYVIFTYFANFTDFACENGHDGPRDHVLLGIATPISPPDLKLRTIPPHPGVWCLRDKTKTRKLIDRVNERIYRARNRYYHQEFINAPYGRTATGRAHRRLHLC